LLRSLGEQVVEAGRPKRPPRRTSPKTDAIDAVRAARDALGQPPEQLPAVRQRGDHQALRVLLTTRRTALAARVAAVNQLKALVVAAPEEPRAELRGLPTKRQIAVCAALRDRPTRSLEHPMTVRALCCTARRIQALQAEAVALLAELERLVAGIVPWLLELVGVGPVSAAQLLVSWSHAGRFRSEAAFAALAGTNPIPALVALLQRVQKTYRAELTQLKVEASQRLAPPKPRHEVVVLLEDLDQAALAALQYARQLNPLSITALHIAVDPDHARELAHLWAKVQIPIPLEIVDAPDRNLPATVEETVAEMVRPDTEVTVLVPRRRYVGFWRRVLHDQTSAELTKVLGDLDNVNVTIVPYRLRRRGGLTPVPSNRPETAAPDRQSTS